MLERLVVFWCLGDWPGTSSGSNYVASPALEFRALGRPSREFRTIAVQRLWEHFPVRSEAHAMTTKTWALRELLPWAAVLAVILALTLPGYLGPLPTAYAQGAQFDYVTIVSTVFLYNGERGLLLLDRRNGNVWFMAHKEKVFQDPVLVTRVPFEKLDLQP